jgi:hypothetical protein
LLTWANEVETRLGGVTTGTQQRSKWFVVPITTYNTVRGFGVSDQGVFANKIAVFMAVLLLLLLLLPTSSLLLPCTDKQQAH